MGSSHTTRRQFLHAAGLGAVAAAGTAGLGLAAKESLGRLVGTAGAATPSDFALGATDGRILLPNLPQPRPTGLEHDELYIFGFRPVPLGMSVPNLISNYKGKAQTPAPILDFKDEQTIHLTLTNLGLIQRPDLTDGHTIHWHGFRTPSALYDGVPEVSVAVPIAKQFTYFYKPHDPGTYMWHCHFEDVEHVQMGMTGIVFVRPSKETPGGQKYAYDDTDGSTAYDRHFALLLNEIWSHPHDNGFSIQESIWTDYDPNYWIINGRVYPDTVKAKNDPTLPGQPISSLIQCNPGERVLLRLANLGYEQHAMQLPGIPMRVVGEDATLRQSPYMTNTIYIGPGEARDVIFVAPDYTPDFPALSDGLGSYNRYYFKNRDYSRLNNNGASDPVTGLGGMMTEVRVYHPGNAVPLSDDPNQTFGV
jgi:FtsP/CotA-like multicopper oxidase with cupredoxin domain